MYQKILDVTWERLTEISVPTEQVNALDLQGLLSHSLLDASMLVLYTRLIIVSVCCQAHGQLKRTN